MKIIIYHLFIIANWCKEGRQSLIKPISDKIMHIDILNYLIEF